MPNCWIIAGPNGAGKTTFAMEFLPRVAECDQFINADLIASGLNPFNPRKEQVTASKLFLNAVHTAVLIESDFAFETTLAGKSNLKLIRKLRDAGWNVELIYLALPSVEMCRRRVNERVVHGGHDIPASDIKRRFYRSLSNLFGPYSKAVTRTRCFMNQFKPPQFVFEQCGERLHIENLQLFELLKAMH